MKIIQKFLNIFKTNNRNEFTLAIIKPDAFDSCIGIRDILMQHFFIEKTKVGKYTREKAEEFYNIHKGQPFFEGLMKHTCSGKCMAMILRSKDGSDAIDTLRKIIGNTDPKKAKEGTIRQLFGTELPKNAIHASDSFESFKREVKLIFGIDWEF